MQYDLLLAPVAVCAVAHVAVCDPVCDPRSFFAFQKHRNFLKSLDKSAALNSAALKSAIRKQVAYIFTAVLHSSISQRN